MAQGKWHLRSHDVGTHYEQHYIYQKASPNPAIDGAYHVAQAKHLDDALLIVSAPDLLAALEALIAFPVISGEQAHIRDTAKQLGTPNPLDVARAAIAKAKGNE